MHRNRPSSFAVLGLLVSLGGLALATASAAQAGSGASENRGPRWRAALFDELEPLYDDSRTEQGATKLRLDAATGTIVAVHVLLTDLEPGRAVRLGRASSPGVARESLDPFTLARLHAVPVEENTGLGSRTEQFEGVENPHVVRRAPFRIFEAIEPLRGRPVLAAPEDGSALALRLEYHVRATFGRRSTPFGYRLAIGHAGDERILELRIEPHAVRVPAAGRDTLRYTNWYSPTEIADRHGLEAWSEAHWDMLRRYAALMARGRQNTFWIRWADVFAWPTEARGVLDRARLERLVETFTAEGLWWIEGSPLARRPGGDWSKEWLQLQGSEFAATGEDGEAALTAMLDELRICLEDNGWTERWVQHLADEPTDTNAADYRVLASIVREHLPGVPIVEATMSRELAGAVDIWCPQVQKFDAHRAFFEERRAAGDTLWTYTCLVPGGPWLNRLLDQERLRQVYFGWAASRYELDGFLHWGFNHWKADPFVQSVVDHPAQPGTKNKLPAGDTHVVFPGPDGPWSGLRFEAHRIGLEDHWMLEQLRIRDPQRHDEVAARLFRAYDDWEPDVGAYRATRRALLEAIAGVD